jgi:internalin A
MTPLHLSAAIIERLGWVLVHSVWQLALIAMAALVLQRAMRRASAAMRYWVLLLVLGAMLATPIATWLTIPHEGTVAEVSAASNESVARPEPSDVSETTESDRVSTPPLPITTTPLFQAPAAAAPLENVRGVEPMPAAAPAALSSLAAWQSWIEQRLRPWLNSLVLAWCVGVFAFAMRPILSWYRVRRLRTVGVSAAPDAVQQMLERTAQRLGLRHAVRVLQSSVVQTAVVVGYFRPVILLPVSVVAGLSPAQLDAILAHELAHIRRHDYLVNLLQILVETIFFYHPAIWWLSNQVRNERENCCDDMAVAVLGDRVEYGRALLALEEHREAVTVLTMGAGGGSLLARVRRLLVQVPTGRAFSGGSILAIGLLAAATIAVGVWAANGLGEADAEGLGKEPDQVKKEGVIFKAPGSQTLAVALSPDGKILARAGTSPPFGPVEKTGQTIDLWDVASGKKLHTLQGHTETIISLAFSPDGKTLASSTATLRADAPNNEMKLWDVATGKERAPLGGHRKNISFLAFSPDGKTLATSGAPGPSHLARVTHTIDDPDVVRLWDVATGKEKMELGVGASLTSLAFSPDGKTLAMGVGGLFGEKKKPGSVQLWDLTTGKKRASMPGPDGSILSLGFTPDGKTLVSVGSVNEAKELNSQLTLWDVATAKDRVTIPISGCAAMQVAPPLVFTADGKTLITTAWIFEKDSKAGGLGIRLSVQHWDLATGKARATFWTPVNPGGNAGFIGPGIWFSALSADGKTVAWGGRDGTGPPYIGTAHVWEVGSLATKVPEMPKEGEEGPAKKKAGQVFKAPGSETLDVGLSPDGKMLARAGAGETTGATVDLWDVASGKKLHTLKGYAFKVAFSPDGKTLASITGGWGPPAAAGPDGDGPGEVKLWDVATGKERWSVKGHRSRVWSMAFSADGKTLATSSETVKLWDVATGKEKMELPVAYTALAFAPDGKTLAVLVGGDEKKPGSVQLWDLTTGKKRGSMPANELGIGSLGFTPDGKTLVSAGLREPNEGEEGPNRNTKAAGSLEGYFCQFKLWDVATAKERATIPISGNFSLPFFPLVFTADSRTLMTARWISDKEGKKVRVRVQHWDLATGKEVATFWTPVNPGGNHRAAGHVAGIRFAALSADGKTVAWGGAEGPKEENFTGTAHVWEVGSLAASPPEIPKEAAEQKKDEPLVLTAHKGDVWSDVWSVSVSADGKRLLTCSQYDKTLRLWDTDTGKQLRVFEGHTDGVIWAELSPDGKRVLSGSADKTVRLWDADTGKELRKMTGHPEAVYSVAFGPEGQAISGGGPMDGTMRLWDLNTGKQAAVFSVDGYPIALAYSAKARLAATYTWTRIRLWDLETGKEVRKWTGHGHDFNKVCFSPDGTRLLTPSAEGTVHVWDVKSGKELKQILAHKETFNESRGASCAAFSADGKRIVSGGACVVRVWDAESGKEVHKYEGHTGPVRGVAFFPDGKRIASASEDGTVRIWRVPGELPAKPPQDQADDAEAKAALAITKLGGKVTRDDKLPGKPVIAVILAGTTKVTDAGLKELKELKQLTSLNLGATKVTAAGVKELKELKQLTSLDLTWTWGTAAVLKELKDFKQLTSLNLAAGGVTNASLKELKDLKQLTSLNLNFTGVTDAGMKELADLKQLTSLNLGNTDVGDAGLKELKHLKQLTTLDLSGNIHVTDAGLKELADLKQLTSLNLGATNSGHPQVTDAGLKELKDLKQLTTLNLDGTLVTAAGVKELKGLKQLTTLKLEVTDASLKELKDLKQLTTLYVGGGKKTEAGLKELAHLKQLTTLFTGGAGVTDAVLAEWKDLKQLTYLSLDGAKVTDAGMKELANFKQLTTLYLGSAPVTGAGFAELKDLKQLTSLDLQFTPVTDAGLKELKHLKQLTTLNLKVTQVTDAGLAELKDLKQLTTLNLGNTKVTDAGLKELKDLKQLTSLSLDGTGVTRAGVKELQAALPELKFEGVPDPKADDASGAAAKSGEDSDGKADEASAVKAVENLFGKVTRDDKLPGKPVIGVTLNNIGATGASLKECLKELKDLKQLTSLNLEGTQVTGAGLKELKDLKQFTRLNLFATKVTDAGLAELADLKQLAMLDLGGCRQVTDAGLKELKDLKQLTSLSLGGTQVTDAGLKELKDLTQLTSLALNYCPVTDAGLAELKDLKQLTSLTLFGAKVTDAGLKELKDLKQLTYLGLWGTQVTDPGLKALAEIGLLHALSLAAGEGDKRPKDTSEVRSLDLRGTQVTDAGLKELKDLKQLTTLSLGGTKVTDAGVKELQAALPRCKIHR